MLILGNSHVSVFEEGILSPDEPVRVHWLGALLASHFLNGHPAGGAAMDWIRQEKGWTFLFIGNHDVQALWHATQGRDPGPGLQGLVGIYEAMFSQLSRIGKIAWVVSVQQSRNVAASPGQEASILKLEGAFREAVGRVCRKLGVPVLDPLKGFRDGSGKIDPAILQKDGLHILHERSELFLAAFARLSGNRLGRNPDPRTRVFRTDYEVGSLAGLFVRELGHPPRATPPRETLLAAIIQTAAQIISARGIHDPVRHDTDLVDTGLLDSLGLVELYTWIHSFLGRNLDFDVDLRAFPTPDALADRFAGTCPGPPGVEDFVVSLEDPQDSQDVLAADRRIAQGGRELLARMLAVEQETCPDSHPYGILDYWKSLAAGFTLEAAQWALRAGLRGFAISPERVRSRVSGLLAGMGQPAGNLHDDLLTIQDGLPIWITVALSNHPDLLKAFLPPWRKSAPEHLELMVLEARVLRSAGDTRGARGILDAVDARWPWMADAKVLRGEIALDLNERGEANALLLEASKLDPHAIGLAEAMRRWNSLQQPVTDTQQGPGEPPGAPAQDTPAALLQQAQGAMDRNDLARAQELLLAAITKDPTYSAPFLALAKLLLANGDPRMARKVIEAGLDNNPGNAILWDHLIAISVAHEPDRVRTDVRDALAAAPEGGGGRWHQLAALDLMQQGAKEKALQILDKGQHLFPENAHLLEMRRRHFPGR